MRLSAEQIAEMRTRSEGPRDFDNLTTRFARQAHDDRCALLDHVAALEAEIAEIRESGSALAQRTAPEAT